MSHLPLPSAPLRRRSVRAISLFRIAALAALFAVSFRAAPAKEEFDPALQRRLAAEIEKLGPRGGTWGAFVADAKTGRPLAAWRADSLLMPASNRKLLSTALALRTLGPEFTFETRFWARGEIGADGTLRGDLIVEAAGDPTWRPAFLGGRSGVSVLSDFARGARAAGIQRVTGRLLIDTSAWLDPAPVPPGWGWDQTTELYGSLPSALAANENRVVLTISPGEREGEPCRVESLPALETSLSIVNYSRAAAPSRRQTIRLTRSAGPAALILLGEFPRGLQPLSLTVPLPDPTSAWAEVLLGRLRAEGVNVEGPAEIRWNRAAPRATGGAEARLLATQVSPPLERIVLHTNKESDNHCAESLYLAAGRAAAGQASYEAAQAAERAFLGAMGLGADDFAGEDGSGLGRTDLVTPRALVTLLREMRAGRGAEAFRASLPVAGRDGTLRYRLGKAAEGRVRAKTGTLRDVCALSGYLTRPDGRELTFSLIANHYSMPTASIRAAQDRICDILLDADLPN